MKRLMDWMMGRGQAGKTPRKTPVACELGWSKKTVVCLFFPLLLSACNASISSGVSTTGAQAVKQPDDSSTIQFMNFRNKTQFAEYLQISHGLAIGAKVANIMESLRQIGMKCGPLDPESARSTWIHYYDENGTYDVGVKLPLGTMKNDYIRGTFPKPPQLLEHSSCHYSYPNKGIYDSEYQAWWDVYLTSQTGAVVFYLVNVHV